MTLYFIATRRLEFKKLEVYPKHLSNLGPVHKQPLPSFRRRPESSQSLNSLDPGLRRDDVVSEKHAFLDGYWLELVKSIQVVSRPQGNSIGKIILNQLPGSR